jgi:Arc/MetJ family transcription regulator
MKMTMHIDEALLEEVMKATGATSKTAAVDAALRKVARKYAQRERWKVGLNMTPDEIGAEFDGDWAEGLKAHSPTLLAEPTPPIAPHGRKRPR